MICRNKSKLLPNSFPGVYQLDRTCNPLYIGETKKKVINITIEHQQDSVTGHNDFKSVIIKADLSDHFPMAFAIKTNETTQRPAIKSTYKRSYCEKKY